MGSETIFPPPSQLALRSPPPGFTRTQWRLFERDGLLILPGAVGPEDARRYRTAALDCASQFPDYDPSRTRKILAIVHKHAAFEDLIDHERHIGYAYDLYGEQTTLSQADLFIRPRDGKLTRWHVDGPLALPYRVFSPVLPMKLRVVYWLTDLPRPHMGNFVYIPGSHKPEYLAQHAELEDVPGQEVLCCGAGTMTIMHTNLWHRVMANESDQTRFTVSATYVPSWCARYYDYPKPWADRLPRERRILVRAVEDQKELLRPGPDDIPLFRDPGGTLGDERNEPHRVRRFTRFETTLRAASKR